MQKVRLIGLKKHEAKVLEFIQAAGVMEVQTSENPEAWAAGQGLAESKSYQLARLEFTLNSLAPYAPKRGFLAGKPSVNPESAQKLAAEFAYQPIIAAVEEIENERSGLRAQIAKLDQDRDLLAPWQELTFDLSNPRQSEKAMALFLTVPSQNLLAFQAGLKEKLHLSSADLLRTDKDLSYFFVLLLKEQADVLGQLLVEQKGQMVDLPSNDGTPADLLKQIAKAKAGFEQELEQAQKKLASLAKDQEKLQIIHDYYLWDELANDASKLAIRSGKSFILDGWIPKRELFKLEEDLNKIGPVEILALRPAKDEEAPVALRNKPVIDIFESVTKVYGLPLARELDPTPFLATFFIVFFGLCLTDAAYGLILFALTALMLTFMKMSKESQKLIKLIMFGGVVTFVAGIFFGGWFGMTPAQAPSFLTTETVNAAGETVKQFKFQIINPTSGSGPLTFLIFAFILGVIQVLFGIAVDGYGKLRNKQYLDALLDSGLRIAFLLALLGFGLSAAGILPAGYLENFKLASLIGTVLMVLTQGRKQKGIMAKFGMGLLSLYGLIGYASDILSYSRIMALGLGTGVIAFAINTIASLVNGLIPYVGIVLAILILIIGHTVNIALNALGAFIHSGRLQFIEFFSKFLEGGGREFRPLHRQCKYVMIETRPAQRRN